MRERILILVVLGIAFINILSGQTSSIKGTIIDTKTGETLIGATVFLDGTTKGTTTDFDGKYEISNVPAGTYNVMCSYVSYQEKVVADVTIASADIKEINFYLSEAVNNIREVTVVAKKRRESEQFLLVERRESSIAIESIGSNELARKGAGNVAAGVKKISGVSMIGEKQLFVRGLGDRYNSLQINGLPTSSPDPTKKIIKLDLFSSDIIKAISVNKVYTVENYADYTGALINIETKDYPTNPFVKLSYGTGYNTQSSLKSMKQINSVGNNFGGLSNPKRKNVIPTEAKNYNRSNRYTEEIFATDYNYKNKQTPLNQDFGISAGKLFKTGKREVGVLFASSYENSSDNFLGINKRTIKNDGTNEDSWTTNSYEYGTNITSLLNISYKHNVKNSISYNMFYLNSSEDRFKEIRGRDNENRDIYSYYGEFENHKLFNNQLIGEHTLSDKLKLSWGASFAKSTSDLPDLRQIKLKNINDEYRFYTDDAQGTMRLNLELEEYNVNGKIGLQYNITELTKIKVGAQRYSKTRASDAYIHYYDVNGVSDIVIEDPELAGTYITKQNFEDGNLLINNGSTWDNKYNGLINVIAAYASYEHNFKKKTTVNLGLRVEKSEMTIEAYSSGGIPLEVVLDGTDIFPSLNIKHKTSDKSNLRFSASRTITRPSFHEKSPAKVPPRSDEDPEYGNINLINSFSNSLEIKYEIFPAANELISFGIYGKQIKDPIERITKQTGGGTIFTYQNTKEGIAAGIEFEVKKKFNNLFTGLNLAYIYTNVKTPAEDNGTNSERMLQGASPYLINTDLGYDLQYGESEKHKTSFALIYNVFGERIYSVGSDGKGDIYQLPAHSLDFLIRNKISSKLEISLKATNILNSKTQYEQDYYTDVTNLAGRLPVEGYQEGIEYSISLGYTF